MGPLTCRTLAEEKAVAEAPAAADGEIWSDPQKCLENLGYKVLGYQPHEFEVVRYEPAQHRELWDAFVRHSLNGNLFQTRRFLSYHPPGRFEDHSLLFLDRQRLLAVAAGEVTDGRWSSQRFTSHAGLTVTAGLRADRCLDLVHSLLSYAERQGWRQLTMRYAPDLLCRPELATLHWALEILGFAEQGRELAWCFLPGPRGEEELFARYANGASGAVSKARKDGLIARRSEDFDAYWSLLESNLAERFAVQPTHSLEEIQRLRQLCPGEIELLAVYDQRERMLAGAIVFDISPAAAHEFYSAQDYRYQHLRATSLLMHELGMEYAVRRNKILNLGVMTAHGAQELNLGLSWFKQSFGATPSIRRSFSYRFSDH